MRVAPPTPATLAAAARAVAALPSTARLAAAAAGNAARSGVVGPTRPDRALRQGAALGRWGLTLPGALEVAAAHSPAAPAVLDETAPGAWHTTTWGGLADRAHRLGAALADGAPGVPAACEQDRVGVLCRNHAGMVTALLALSLLGADAVLLNTGAGADQVHRVLAAQRVRLVLADEEFAPLLEGSGAAVVTVRPPGAAAESPQEAPGVAPGAGPTLDSLVDGVRAGRRLAKPPRPGRLIVLTSGTTGTPKGAARPEPSARAAALALAGLLSRLPLRAGAPTLIPAPLFHTWGLAALQLCLASRAPMVLAPRFDPERTLAAAAAHRARQMFAVPVMLSRILALPPEVRASYDTSALRLVASSGSALPAATVTGFLDAYGDVLFNLYGSTEVSWVSVAVPAELRAAPGTAGRPPLGTRLALLDPDGRPVRRGATGRIFVGNAMLFGGYTGGDRADHPETRAGLMATGDLGHLDAAGLLHVDGREDDMVVSGGENVFPREVEDVIAAAPGVREAAVVGVPDEAWGQRLAAFVVLADGAAPDAEAVRELVRARLARHCVPRDVTFLAELPRNATGKVLARELRERAGG